MAYRTGSTHSAGIKVMEPGGGLKPASTRASPEVTPQQRLTVSNMLMQLSISGQCKQRAQEDTDTSSRPVRAVTAAGSAPLINILSEFSL